MKFLLVLLWAMPVFADELTLAAPILPILQAEIQSNWPAAPFPLLAGQASHESACPAPKKCWNPKVEFNTARERGAGILQITKVYGRFDSLAEMKARHPELADWNWEKTLYVPQFQMRGLVLLNRDNYKHFEFAASERQRMAFTLTAYNAGVRGVFQDRALCRHTEGCKPNFWFGGVENTCTASKVKQKGYGLSFCEIRQRYARDIFERSVKYERFYRGGF